jgi:hypothetical protein
MLGHRHISVCCASEAIWADVDRRFTVKGADGAIFYLHDYSETLIFFLLSYFVFSCDCTHFMFGPGQMLIRTALHCIRFCFLKFVLFQIYTLFFNS